MRDIVSKDKKLMLQPERRTGIRLTADDDRIIAALKKKMGVKNATDLLRQGLRLLAEQKGIAA